MNSKTVLAPELWGCPASVPLAARMWKLAALTRVGNCRSVARGNLKWAGCRRSATDCRLLESAMLALRGRSKPGRSGSVAKGGDSWSLAWGAIDDGGLGIFSPRLGSCRVAKNKFPVIIDGTAIPSDSAPAAPLMLKFRVRHTSAADEDRCGVAWDTAALFQGQYLVSVDQSRSNGYPRWPRVGFPFLLYLGDIVVLAIESQS
ncbi:hypothetical protein B0H63DRAFT_456158 [Podospora didyma]|uniref:Uncharacterized protein n=1 Tax=Podospora didyma TaxID=330526 RepID=A0AAE0JY41_9PEZI|nr:hypothetical protein B0H63DRAFT_456158 [Podospora didyma]